MCVWFLSASSKVRYCASSCEYVKSWEVWLLGLLVLWQLTCSVSPLNGPSDSEKLESRPLSTEDRLVPTTILRIEGAFCTFELIAGIGTFRDTPEALEARPSDETTRLTTRPFPVEGATGGLGACLLDEDGLKAEVETGLLKLKLKIKCL